MAWETGTAAGHNDLLNKLLTFLSTNADLVAAKQNWSILRNSDLPYSAPAPARFAFSARLNAFPRVAPDNWPTNIPTNGVKVKFTGKLSAPSAGNYVFSLRVADSAEIRIDGKLVAGVYQNNSADSFVSTVTVNLTAGLHDIDIQIVSVGTSGTLGLGWQRPGVSNFEIIPASAFSGMTAAYGKADYVNPSAADFAAQMGTREVFLCGPGLSQQDQIFINLRTLSSAQGDIYNIVGRYATGYDENRLFDDQPGGPNLSVYSLLWNQSIKYWFIASGRRFIVIAKISTTYASLYGGFILPYGLPSEIPYPIAIGASSAELLRWSSQSDSHSSFWNPGGPSNIGTGALYMRRTDGGIETFKNISSGSSSESWTYPYRFRVEYRSSPSGDYALEPVVPYSSTNGGNVWGELDGVYAISGFNNASENTQVIDGNTYLVVQSGYRTRANDYAAILLE